MQLAQQRRQRQRDDRGVREDEPGRAGNEDGGGGR
jgi:hypothetical protein